MNKETKQQVTNDMSLEFNTRLAKLLKDIDNIKQEMLISPERIINLTERLQATYVLLSGKMIEPEETKQLKFNRVISKIKVFGHKRKMDGGGSVFNQKIIYKKEFMRCKTLLELREIHINKCMERIGLTNKEVSKRRVI